MHDVMLWLPPALGGIACGAGFFGGLWWTIRGGLRSNQAALWFFISTLVRTVGVIAVFVLIAQSDPQRWLACAGGFVVARVAAQRVSP